MQITHHQPRSLHCIVWQKLSVFSFYTKWNQTCLSSKKQITMNTEGGRTHGFTILSITVYMNIFFCNVFVMESLIARAYYLLHWQVVNCPKVPSILQATSINFPTIQNWVKEEGKSSNTKCLYIIIPKKKPLGGLA